MKTLIAIPTYNSGNLLLNTVDSALSQTKKSGILIIDNNSSDNTDDIIKNLKSDYHDNLFTLRNSTNVGRVGNWNKCLEFFYNSDYEFIKFLFPGDLIELNCIEECEKVFKKYNDLAAVAYPYYFVEGENKFISSIKSIKNRYLASDDVMELNFKKGGVLGAIISHVYAKKAINNIFFDEKYVSKLGFDIKITENGSVYYLNKILATFVKEHHKTFDSADSTLGYLEFSFIEIIELNRLKSENKVDLKKFRQFEQAIISNTIKRMLRFSESKVIINSIFVHLYFVIFNGLRKHKKNKILILIKKLYYNYFNRL